MDTLPNLKEELKHEYETTKKFFDRFPDGKNDFAPHEKSMKMMPLATHVAEIFAWPALILHTDKLDFGAGDYKPTVLHTKAELLDKLEADYKEGMKALDNTTEAELVPTWTMNNGETVLAKFNKYSAIRHALNQITHHRAQLGTYYRQMDIPLPGSYGPSADDHKMS